MAGNVKTTSKLTALGVGRAIPTSSQYKLFDGGGLHLVVTPDILGQAGTFKKALRCMYCRSWAGGQRLRWCKSMRTYPVSTWRNG